MPADNYIPDLSTEKLNSICPYFLLLNIDLTIDKCGHYWASEWAISPGSFLKDRLTIYKPQLLALNFEQLIEHQEHLFILTSIDQKLQWRGHIEYFEKTKQVLFTGNPLLQTVSPESIAKIEDSLITRMPVKDAISLGKEPLPAGGLNEFSSKKEAFSSLTLIAAEINNGVIITNKKGEIIWVNNGFERITEFALAEVKGKKPGSFLQGPETDNDTVQYLRTQILNKSSFSCEILNYSKSGRAYWIKISGHPIFEEGGMLSRFFSIQEDITERKAAEKRLLEQKIFYERILNEIPADIAVFDPAHHYLFVNPKGIKNDDLRKWIIGKRDEDYLTLKNKPLSIAEDRRKLFNKVVQNKKILSWEETLTNPQGNKEYHLRTMMPVLDDDQKVKMVIGYGLDITNRRKVEEQLIINEKRYRDLFNFSQALICTHDANGKFLSVNPAICDTLGYASQEMINHPITEFLPAENQATFNTLYLEKVMNEGKAKGVFIVLNKKKEKIYLLFQNFKVEEEGMDTYIIGFSQDITDRIKIEKALLEAKEQVEMTSKAKEIFLANMSHEIRTPMNGILGLGNLLYKTNLTPKQREFTKLIIESGNNLMYIVNDILDYTKIQSAQFKLESIPFDLAEKVNSTIQTFHFKAEEKSVALIFKNSIKDNLIVEGDPHRLGQVLNNLLSNAFKFTSTGSVTVQLNEITKDSNHPLFEIRVTDTGMGIKKENIAPIFEQFVQASPDITRKFGGTGLGLSICKTLLDLQGGTIEVESEVNKGTTFIVKINYKKIGRKSTDNEDQVYGTPRTTLKKKILVAEDVQINQLIVKHILKGWGHSVTIVENGKEVLKLLEKNQYDLILMDIHMPEMNGEDTTRQIRKLSNPKKANIPIIAVSAAAFEDEIDGYLKSGMNDFITKPYTEEKLLEVFNRVLQIASPTDQSDHIKKTKSLNKMEKLYDLTRLNEFGDNDPGFIKEIIGVFLVNTGKDLDDLTQAVKAENYQLIAEIAHRMKSSLHTMGVKSLETAVKDMEVFARQNEPFSKINPLSMLVKKTLDLVFDQLKTDFKQD